MQGQSSNSNNELFCKQVVGNKKRFFKMYRGFKLATVKLLVEYNFSGYILKIEDNQADSRFDIYLTKTNKTSSQEINMKEVEKFSKFFGKGFNIILLERNKISFMD